jgi:hypothetical protein
LNRSGIGDLADYTKPREQAAGDLFSKIRQRASGHPAIMLKPRDARSSLAFYATGRGEGWVN